MGKWGWLCVWCLLSLRMGAQDNSTLLRIDGEPVNVSEYRSFVAGKPAAGSGIEDFIDFKLKALAGRKAEMDTLPQIRQALELCKKRCLADCMIDNHKADSAARAYYGMLKTGKFVGKVRVCQIFKSLPQNVSSRRLERVESEMDSLYQALESGRIDFETCVRNSSEDKSVFWVEYLQMPAEFEEVVFTLPEGQISCPFFTPQGLHIVKVLERKELPAFEQLKGRLAERVVQSKWNEVASARVERLKKKFGYKVDKDGVADLMRNGKTDKALFVLDGRTYSGKEFAWFAASHPASLRWQLENFVKKTVLDYESRQLLTASPEFASDIYFYRDSLLGAEMERREFGERILLDTVGVEHFFETHRKQYHWSHSRYDGIVLHCKSKRIAKRVRKFLKKLPSDEWMEAIRLGVNAGDSADVIAQRGLFAKGDNPYVDEHVFKGREASPMEGFPYVALVGEKIKGPLRWQDVGGQLWADYYHYREQGWLHRLRQMFKVEINQEVLKTVNNH